MENVLPTFHCPSCNHELVLNVPPTGTISGPCPCCSRNIEVSLSEDEPTIPEAPSPSKSTIPPPRQGLSELQLLERRRRRISLPLSERAEDDRSLVLLPKRMPLPDEETLEPTRPPRRALKDRWVDFDLGSIPGTGESNPIERRRQDRVADLEKPDTVAQVLAARRQKSFSQA